jgi:hypothetical protein
MKVFYVRSCETDIAFDDFQRCLARALSDGQPQSELLFVAILEDLPKELEADVFAGKLPVKNPLTFGPETFPIGSALHTSRVMVRDIPDYVKERGVTVAVMPEVTQQAHVVAVDPQLKNFPRHAPVYYTHKNGAVSGAGIAKVGDFIDSENERITRQSEGYFTLDEAADILAPVSGEDSANLVRDMQTAHREEKLIVRNPVHKRPIPLTEKSSWSDLVMPADVDAWLENQGVDYRFPKTTQPLNGIESGNAPSSYQSIQNPRERTPHKMAKKWRDIAWDYVVETHHAGQYTTAKTLFKKLEAIAGTNGSPFQKGVGANLGKLFIGEISVSVSLKTIQNAWSAIKNSNHS